MRRITIGLALMASAALSCGGGSGVLYYRVAYGEASLPMGSNCPGSALQVDDYSNVSTAGTWTVYPSAGGTYLLDGASEIPAGLPAGEHFGLLEGKRNGSTYTFTGNASVDEMAASLGDTTVMTTVTIKVSASGPGLTGSLSAETKCTSTSGEGCTGFSHDGKDTDCTVQVPILATQISNVTAQTDAHAATPGGILGTGNSSVDPPPGSCTTDMDCANNPDAPVCYQGFCVQCGVSTDCAAPFPVCGPSNTCVECATDSDCTIPGDHCQSGRCG